MKLSIIVPVYNAGGGYLIECLNSLTKQGFQKGEHEVIVVNDGSTDNTEEIIDKFCEKYDYFVKINKINGGVSSARNYGIERAILDKSDYIAFIDADDMFAENAYLVLLDICYREDLDAVYFQATKEQSEITKIYNEKLRYTVLKHKQVFYATRNIFKTSIIVNNNIRFDTIMKYSEDSLFSFYFACFTTRVVYFENLLLYFYRENEFSAINNLNKETCARLQPKDGMTERLINANLSEIRFRKKVNIYKKKYKIDFIGEMDYNWYLYKFLYNCLHKKVSAKTILNKMKQFEISNWNLNKKKLKTFKDSTGTKECPYAVIYKVPILYRIACFIYKIIK